MNTNLLTIVKQIIASYGETVFADPARLKAFFGDLAKDEPKPLRIAFGRCIEARAYDALKTASDAAERAKRKTAIVQRVFDEHGLAESLCAEAMDILEAALFGAQSTMLSKPTLNIVEAPPVKNTAKPAASVPLNTSKVQDTTLKQMIWGYWKGKTIIAIILGVIAYLDITTDIMVALHFVCSVYHFLLEGEDIKSLQSENSSDGCLYVFDLNGIEKSELLELIFYPNYSYFCKEKTGDKIYFQPFNRITHQRGAFLAPKRDKAGEINYETLRGEIKKYIHAKITIKGDVKKQLYDIFGKEQGLEYYFPKIPSVLPTGDKKIQQAYEKLKLIALLEKKE